MEHSITRTLHNESCLMCGRGVDHTHFTLSNQDFQWTWVTCQVDIRRSRYVLANYIENQCINIAPAGTTRFENVHTVCVDNQADCAAAWPLVRGPGVPGITWNVIMLRRVTWNLYMLYWLIWNVNMLHRVIWYVKALCRFTCAVSFRMWMRCAGSLAQGHL